MNRRREERLGADLPIEIVPTDTRTRPFLATIRDLSAGGAFIQSALPFSVGDLMFCSFELYDQEKSLSLFAKVVHVDDHWQEATQENRGFGIQFIDTTVFDRFQIRFFLDQFAISNSPAERMWFH